MNPEAAFYIKKLALKIHPEGGYYSETYRSDETIDGKVLPDRFKNRLHSFSTSIYFLLEGSQVSRFHRLQSDEIWYFHSGTRGIIHFLTDRGELHSKPIGNGIDKGDNFQLVIKRNSWFCAEVEDKSSYFLVSCSVSPGFEFIDFELADRKNLLDKYPLYKKIILKFT